MHPKEPAEIVVLPDRIGVSNITGIIAPNVMKNGKSVKGKKIDNIEIQVAGEVVRRLY